MEAASFGDACHAGPLSWHAGSLHHGAISFSMALMRDSVDPGQSSKVTQRPTIDLSTSLRGKNALVTGGSSGIGKATVEILLDHGANVALTYHHGKDAAEALVRRWPDRVSGHFLDLRSEDSVSRCFADFAQRWQSLDILVNNAAAGSTTVEDYEPDPGRRDEALFQINALGAFRVLALGLALMQSRPAGASGKLINVASPGVIQKFPSLRLADSASKSVLVHLTRELAAQLVQTNIEVFAVCPGPTNTPMFRRSTLDALSEEQRRAFIAELPKGHLLEPEEIANIIVFLASDYARAMHGAVIDASMGLTTR